MPSDDENDDVVTQEFHFVEWSKANGLSRDTTSKLSKEALDKIEALILLELKDIMELALPVGQRVLLIAAIKKEKGLRSASHTRTQDAVADTGIRGPDAAEQPDVDGACTAQTNGLTIRDICSQAATLRGAGKALDDILSGDLAPHAPLPLPVASTGPTLTSASDPCSILTIKASSAKAVHITQFLTEKTKKRLQSRRKGIVLGTNVDNSVVLQSDDRHPYSGITLSEWGASNTRIMAHLLKSGQLAADKIDYYLAYTTTIFEYYELYEWEGVLEFDHLYRERQAEHQFQWGYIPPHMELSLLARPRRPASRHNGPWGAFNGRNKPSFAGSKPRVPKDEECRNWKNSRGKCPYGDECIFQHPPLKLE